MNDRRQKIDNGREFETDEDGRSKGKRRKVEEEKIDVKKYNKRRWKKHWQKKMDGDKAGSKENGRMVK